MRNAQIGPDLRLSVETPISENNIKVAKLEFDEEDNSDFKLMFAKIPRTKLPEDLTLF